MVALDSAVWAVLLAVLVASSSSSLVVTALKLVVMVPVEVEAIVTGVEIVVEGKTVTERREEAGLAVDVSRSCSMGLAGALGTIIGWIGSTWTLVGTILTGGAIAADRWKGRKPYDPPPQTPGGRDLVYTRVQRMRRRIEHKANSPLVIGSRDRSDMPTGADDDDKIWVTIFFSSSS